MLFIRQVSFLLKKMADHRNVGRDALMNKFKELGIEDIVTVEHPEVFTVEEMMPYVKHEPGIHCKNLFLRDKKKKLYLFAGRHNLDVKLNELAKKVSASGGLRFADESVLIEKLGVRQGCVTVYALINDKNNDVKLVLDSALVEGGYPRVFFHPLTNAASTGIKPEDLVKFLDNINHKPLLITFDE